MPFLIHLLLGTFISFFAAMPLGPVNLAVVQTALNQGRNQAILVAVGSSTMELLYCLLAVIGVDLLFSNQRDQDVFVLVLQMLSIPFILSLGFYNLFRRVKTDEEEGMATKKVRKGGGLMLGFTLNFFNPMLLPFWLMVATFLRSRSWLSNDLAHLLIYSMGVMLGTFLLQLSVALVAARKQAGMSYKSKVTVTRIIGYLFIGLGLYVAYLMAQTMLEIGWL
ncbi:MAG: LysE family translocator [Bacteroidetes bacterium]|jgi:L-lysine exporter family protein LysE/ArgO|nr:LysE family translocator [Bacteroidota bacterium]